VVNRAAQCRDAVPQRRIPEAGKLRGFFLVPAISSTVRHGARDPLSAAEYGRSGHDCEARVIDYEAGTLVLDTVDARTNRLVWRGSARQSVDALIDNQDWMDKYVDQSIARTMATFPASGSSGDVAASER
jgi:Domain of unknown function (DUF4136)